MSTRDTSPMRRARLAAQPVPQSACDGVVTVVFGGVALYVVCAAASGSCSSPADGRSSRVNLKLLMVGRFPDGARARGSPCVVVLALWGGFIAGIIRARQIRGGRAASRMPGSSAARVRDSSTGSGCWSRSSCCCSRSRRRPGPWLTRRAAAVAAVLGPARRSVRRPAGASAAPAAPCSSLALGAVPIVLFVYVVDAAGCDEWGGFMLNVFLAAVLDRAVLPARRAARARPAVEAAARPVDLHRLHRDLPRRAAVRAAAARQHALEFFVPADLAPSKVTRAIVVFTLFTGAYMAEIVRGGLQSVPRGQDEAAKALGLSPVRQTSYRAAAGAAQRDPGPDRSAHQPVQGHHAGRRGDGPVRAARTSPDAITSQAEFRGPAARAPRRWRSRRCCSGRWRTR